MITIEERFYDFLSKVNDLAAELHLEVEFTTRSTGGWQPIDEPIVEVGSTDTHEYWEKIGRLMIDGKKADSEIEQDCPF